MPHRNSTIKEQPGATVVLRRSPRFLRKCHPPPEEPKCGFNFPNKSNSGSRRSAILSGGVCLRRSPRFSGTKSSPDDFFEKKSFYTSNLEDLSIVGRAEVGIYPCREFVAKMEKRVTRSSSRRNADECVQRISNKGKCGGFTETDPIEVSEAEDLLDIERAKVGDNSRKHSGVILEKRVTHSSAAKKGVSNGFNRSSSAGVFYGEDSPDVKRAEVGANSCEKIGGKLEKRTIWGSGVSSVLVGGEGKKERDKGKKERDIDKGLKKNGVKRKRSQVDEGHGVVQGWTKDQELALQRAYFAAKPTPHFWKKVSKMVPGKSAKDCFDKVHGDHLTPPQPRTRLRPRKMNLPSFSLSSITLLTPEKTTTRRPSRRKQSSHLAPKTVRQLLQKHYNVDQNEADLFSVLESTFESTQEGLIHSTPIREQEKPGYLKKCCKRSSSGHKERLSRFSSPFGSTLVSPPVLKQVKNKALHDRYVDQLHHREAKRWAASAHPTKVVKGKENRKQSDTQKRDVPKAAKDALVFYAENVIHQFQHVKVSAMTNYSDLNDDYVGMDDDEVQD